tara:strand:- start:706 stop:939 length:234 start_codon:yes stop_codon:yes gene_type:complete
VVVPTSRVGIQNAQQERIMAVPKRKMSKSKSRSRKASAWRVGRTARSTCPNCGASKRPHRACGNCGWYAGRQAIEVD